jgi:hypothetical protein
MKVPTIKHKTPKVKKVRSPEEQEEINKRMALLRAKKVSSSKERPKIDNVAATVIPKAADLIIPIKNQKQAEKRKSEKVEKIEKTSIKPSIKPANTRHAIVPKESIGVIKDKKGKLVTGEEISKFKSRSMPALTLQPMSDGSELVKSQIEKLNESVEEKKLLRAQIERGSGLTEANQFLLSKYGITELDKEQYDGYNKNKERIKEGIELEYHVYFPKDETTEHERPNNFVLSTNPIVDFRTNDTYIYHFPFHFNLLNRSQYVIDFEGTIFDISSVPSKGLFAAIQRLGESITNGNFEMTTLDYELLEKGGFILHGEITLEVSGVMVITKLKGMNSQKKTQLFSKVNRLETKVEQVNKMTRKPWLAMKLEEWTVIKEDIEMSIDKKKTLPMITFRDVDFQNSFGDNYPDYAIQFAIRRGKDEYRLVRLQVLSNTHGIHHKQRQAAMDEGEKLIKDNQNKEVLKSPFKTRYCSMLFGSSQSVKRILSTLSLDGVDGFIEIKS